MSIKVMGREFRSIEEAIHWVEVGIRLTSKGENRERLQRELRKLKGQIK